MSIIMVTGGVRSGKSAYAEQLVQKKSLSLASNAKVLYVATGMRSDGEMNERISAHQHRRPATWDTREESHALSVTSYGGYDIVLLDTLSAWISNVLIAVPEEQCRDDAVTNEIKRQILNYIDELQQSTLHCAIVVTDEVGWGGVAMSPLGRWFQDVIGEVNQQLASRADEVFAVISGLPWRLK